MTARVGRRGWIAVVALLAGCGDTIIDPLEERERGTFQGTTSEPVDVVAIEASGSAPSIAFLSMDPGAMPEAELAMLTNRRTGASAIAPMVGGGFDPVGIPAAEGDSVDVAFTLTDGSHTYAVTVVPARKRPRIVRTSPARGRTDVAINSSIVIVLSEPLGPGSRDTAHIRLRTDGTFVEGEVRPVPGSQVALEWIPAEPLVPGTGYELVLSDDITDLAGDPIEGTLVIEFSTLAAPTPVSQVLAYQDFAHRFAIANADGSDIHIFPGFQVNYPEWAPDGLRIAFHRWDADNGLHVINADGGDLRKLTGGPGTEYDAHPAWSPDGTRIVYDNGGDILVVRLADTNRVRLAGPRLAAAVPTWSPDGARIAFLARNDAGAPSLFLMNPDGSDETLLVSNGVASGAAWSRDGTRLYFFGGPCNRYYTAVGGNAACLEFAEGPYLMSVNRDGSGLTQVSTQAVEPGFDAPALSPDESQAMYLELDCTPDRLECGGGLMVVSLSDPSAPLVPAPIVGYGVGWKR